MNTITMLLLFVYYIVYPAFSFWSVRQRVEYKYIKMVIVTLFVSFITPVISLILLYCTDLRENAVIGGYLIVQILIGFIIYLYNFKKDKTFFNKGYWLYALRFNIPLIPHYLSLIVLGQADRIMISNICGSGEAAIYSLAYQVSMLMNIIINAINSAFVPWIYEKLKEKNYEKIKETSKYIGTLIAVMSVGVILIAPEIIKILGTEEYLSAIWIIPAVATSIYFTYCYGLFSNVEFYFGSTNYVMIASSIGAILNIVLNAIFIPLFGFIAAGYTTLVCYLFFMLAHYYFMKRICDKKLEGAKIFDTKFIIYSCVILCGVSAGCMILYNGYIIRYLLMLSILLIIVSFRKKILQILHSLKG